ncbi:MAG: hypothetical protein LBH93_02470 [Chitinispirillales bacterium]|jgi:hypothetical protein|nr:hypothetical protein [Chitinispirillales bacterium]
MVTATETKPIEANPWLIRGLMRYEEKDLAYIDKMVVEAARMGDPEEQRRHLQEAVDMFASKYFETRTAEDLLADADFDLVKVQRVLVDIADDPDPGEGTDYRIVMAEIFGEYDDDDDDV